MLSVNTRNDDGTYGPTKKGKYYLPKLDHRINSTNPIKSKWSINENQELSVFEIAEKPEVELFCKENNCYFSIVNDGKLVMGVDGERIAKFPTPKNKIDPWHGYPTTCTHSYNTPCDDLLDIMEKQRIISKTTRRRIERKKI